MCPASSLSIVSHTLTSVTYAHNSNPLSDTCFFCVTTCVDCAVVLKGLEDSQKWQVKEGALKLLTALADTAPKQVSAYLPTIVPLISERMVDPREQVRCGVAAPRGGGAANRQGDWGRGIHCFVYRP
jgi:hypothetical protein